MDIITFASYYLARSQYWYTHTHYRRIMMNATVIRCCVKVYNHVQKSPLIGFDKMTM